MYGRIVNRIPPRQDRERWRTAVVRRIESASQEMVELVVTPETWIPHLPGQYYDVRFPGERTVRAFSVISSPTETDRLEFGVQVLPRGLLSPRIAAARSGDAIEIRGPVGNIFTWTPEMPGRLVLIGAGAGITPLLSMYALATSGSVAPGTGGAGEAGGAGATTGGVAPRPIFIVSAKSPERIFRYERYGAAMITRFTATEGRIDRAFLADALGSVVPAGFRLSGDLSVDALPPTIPAMEPLQVRICGPLGFIGGVVKDLIDLGIPDQAIRSEAFV